MQNKSDKELQYYAKIMDSRVRFIRNRCNSIKVQMKDIPSLFSADNLKLIHCGFYNTEAEKAFLSSGFGRPILHDLSAKRTADQCTPRRFIKALYVQHPIEKLMNFYNDKTLLQYYFGTSNQSPSSYHHLPVLFPSFKAFLRHILNLTSHAFPFGSLSEQCRVCDVHYDIVILPNSRVKDLEFLFDHLLNLPVNDKIIETMQRLQLRSEKLLTDPSLKEILKEVKLLYSNDFIMFNLTEFLSSWLDSK